MTEMQFTQITQDKYPVLPLRDLVMFPKMIVPLFVGRDKSIKALESIGPSSKIVLLAQKDATKNDPKVTEVYRTGVVAKILQILKLQDSTIKVLVEGVTRVRVTKFSSEKGYLQAQVKTLEDDDGGDVYEKEALIRSTSALFEEYIKLNKKISPDILSSITQIKDPASYCNALSSHLILPVNRKQEILELDSVNQRLEKLLLFLGSEIELLQAEDRVKDRVKSQIEKNQRDYFLNEQLKAIHKELGDEDAKEEINELAQKIKKLKLSKEAREKAESELKKLKTTNPMSSESTIIRNYLDWIIALPWNNPKPVKKDLAGAQKILDKEHSGLEKIKERILEYLAVNIRTKHMNSPIICLVGPPGVGKTSLARSIANATGRNFVKVSLGGLRDEAEIKGHRRTYIGALPGKILQAMKRAKSSNPVMLLDELDKVGQDYRGDPASALLEVLDPEQNKYFSDHYLEVDYDLSQVMFIATANSMNLPRPLLDRMEVIRLSGYTEEEKLQIAKSHLIPKQFKLHGIKESELNLSDNVIQNVIRQYTQEAGVRNLEREIAKIGRKAVKELLEDKATKKVSVTSRNLKKYLGVHKFTTSSIEKEDLVGITNGLAYTEVGGDLLSIEAVTTAGGKGEIKITGKLGDVMKESIQAATSYIRFRANDFGIDLDQLKQKDVHLHVPEGATPKDGPSAGIAVCTSIVSAFTGIPVSRKVAMTGEITLRGRVLPIGGLKEKLLAALRSGVETVVIPKENTKDLEDVPESVKKKLAIVPVDTVDEVLKVALTKPLTRPRSASRGEHFGNIDKKSHTHPEVNAH